MADDAGKSDTGEAAAEAAAKPRISRNVKLGAAAGIGSAAIAAAVLYVTRTRKAEKPSRPFPEDATD